MRKHTHLSILFSIKAWLALGFYIAVALVVQAQDRQQADSLELVYSTNRYGPEEELQILKELAFIHPDPEKSLMFSEQLLLRARQLDSVAYVISALLQKGNALRLKGDVTAALQSYFEGVEIASKKDMHREVGLLYSTIADVYSIMDNRKNTILYYKKAIAILKDANDSLNYASALENFGDEYNLNFAKPDSALILFKQSGDIFRALDHKIGLAYNLGNVGLAYAQKGDNLIAEKNISEAITRLEELGGYYPICVYLTYMSDIYAARNDFKSAFVYAGRSLALAQKYGLKDQISDAYLKLSELYDRTGNVADAFLYYKDHIHYKDSVRNISSVQEMANLRTDLEVAQKQSEVDLLNAQKKTQQVITIATAVALFLIVLLAFGLFRRNRFIRRTKKMIENEKERSDQLLLNILPEETAQELKENGKVKAKKFDSVSVLFTDFKSFTTYAEKLSPEELVESVDFYFSAFDGIIEKYGLEKIKTVGDAYMCAGGLPFPTEDHAIKMVRAAFEIADFVEQSELRASAQNTSFEVRIGINTGPVVAGVVGTKKFAYDIWGDTVNVASRMETMSETGRINISEYTYELVKNHFECIPRGKIYVKNRGMMQMYFVNPSKTEKTADLEQGAFVDRRDDLIMPKPSSVDPEIHDPK